MKLATIAILLGVVVVTILATTAAAHATSKNKPAIEDCFNKSSTTEHAVYNSNGSERR